MPKIDFTGISDSFEPIPAGRYHAVLTGFKTNMSKASNQPYVALEFTLDDAQYGGRKAWQNNSLQPQSLWVLKKNAIALGADPEDLTGEIDTDEMLEALVGSDCRVELDVREYEGRQSNGVTNLYTSYDL